MPFLSKEHYDTLHHKFGCVPLQWITWTEELIVCSIKLLFFHLLYGLVSSRFTKFCCLALSYRHFLSAVCSHQEDFDLEDVQK